MVDRSFAEHFASAWLDAWNAHDLERILTHYVDDVVFHSPRIALVTGEPVASVCGKAALASYWAKALRQATELRFVLERVYVGRDSLSIAYTNHRNERVVETFVFDAKGLVTESIATYA